MSGAGKMHSYKLTQFKAPLTCVIGAPRPAGTQVLLRVKACGVCHSDIHAAPRSDPGDDPAARSVRLDVPGGARARLAHAVAASVDNDGGVRWAGSALADAGFVLALAAAGRFVVQRTTLNPAGQPAHLVVGGAHTWSRNPMYVALNRRLRRFGARARRAWRVDLGRAALGRHELGRDPLEEARLRETFAQDYLDYCRRVRRWI